MAAIDDGVIIEFLRRSYAAVDGLWFMRAETEHSYEEALRLDEQVWRVMPKIQARKARELLGVTGDGLQDLARVLDLKFTAEGHQYRFVANTPERLEIQVQQCPWLDIMRKAGRDELAIEICDHICEPELKLWAGQFSENITFRYDGRLCDGQSGCGLSFGWAPVEAEDPGESSTAEAAG